ncbi:hypothetical protein SynRS9907_01200 [Synechococcus sp. RS9907]|nr:hypothetical protein SynRS9907_01200 [Synechococcus sp. RS9907]
MTLEGFDASRLQNKNYFTGHWISFFNSSLKNVCGWVIYLIVWLPFVVSSLVGSPK